MENRTFDDFDAFADDYRAIHSANIKLSGADSDYFAEMRVRMLRDTETADALNVLDLGCGDGVTEKYMQQYFPQWRLTGIDVSEQSIEAARRLGLNAVQFSGYNGIDIPYADNSFDLVFVAGVLHHVSFDLHASMIREMKRVLKPGGRLVIYEHNPLNPLTRYLVRTCIFDKDAKMLRCSYLSALLKNCGFNITHRRYFIFVPPKGLLRKLIPLEKMIGWLPLGGKYFIRAVK